METNALGSGDLKVSRVGLGTATWVKGASSGVGL
jgi:aryl-alcohol dehydrogenase-like predicted oxidoreductase